MQLYVYKENSAVFTFAMVSKSTGQPVDLSGYTAVFSVKQAKDMPDSLAIITKVIPNLGPYGRVEVTLCPDDTKGKNYGDYHYALKLVKGPDFANTVTENILTVQPFWNSRQPGQECTVSSLPCNPSDITVMVNTCAIPPGFKQTYEFKQVTPAAVWTINHNMACKPSVSLTDLNGAFMLGMPAWPDNNTVTITFSQPVSGWAYLN